MEAPKYDKLTIIIADDAPLIFASDCSAKRRVTIELTKEQQDMIKLKFLGTNGGQDVYERISTCFLESED